MWELMRSGGWILWPIWLCGFAALGLFLERWFHLHRAQIKQEDFLSGIFTLMNRGNRAEAVTICNETPGPVAHLVRTGLLHAGAGQWCVLFCQPAYNRCQTSMAQLPRGISDHK